MPTEYEYDREADFIDETMEDEEYHDFLYWNKSSLRKEFADLNKITVEQVEDYYPDDFDKFCREAFQDSVDWEETKRSLWNDRK